MKSALFYLTIITHKTLFGTLDDVVNTIYIRLQKLEEMKIERILRKQNPAEKFLYQLRGYRTHTDFPYSGSTEFLYSDSSEDESYEDLPMIAPENKPIVDLTNASFQEIIATFVDILQSKLDRRSVDTNYTTNYNKSLRNSFDEKSCDSMYTKIRVNTEYFNFTLNYNGNSNQVGNNLLRESSHENYTITPQRNAINEPKALSWADYEQMSHPLKRLLLADEIARRKVVDTPNKLDLYHLLPVWAAIAIAENLIQSRKLKPKDYYPPYSRYHFFSGENREQAIKELIRLHLLEAYLPTPPPNTTFMDAKIYWTIQIKSFEDLGRLLFEDTEEYENLIEDVFSDEDDIDRSFEKWYNEEKIINIILRNIRNLMGTLV